MKYRVVTPVTAWMNGGVVEAENADDAYEMALDDPTPYPKLCEVCSKRFKLGTPDETAVDIREIEA